MSELDDVHSKVYVAGHRGLVGTAVAGALYAAGYENILVRSHSELDLSSQRAVDDFLLMERPEFVVLAAARVGGILENSRFPAEFIQQNLAIQTNVLHSSWRSGVRRLLFLGSSCIYPRHCPQPIKEEYLLTGSLEETNRAYALAKIAGVEMCTSYNRQYGTEFIALMPTNLYGPADNYDAESSHVIPALIRRMVEATERDDQEIALWGSGMPRREFLHSHDLASACIRTLTCKTRELNLIPGFESLPLINVGTGVDLTIRELADIIAKATGFGGDIRWDTTKPDGTPQKLLDLSRIKALGWSATIPLESGLQRTVAEYRSLALSASSP